MELEPGYPECADRVPTVRQFALGLCGCGFDLRRYLHEESEVEGLDLLELLILRRLEPSKSRFKHCRRIFVEERMLPQVTKVRKTMKKKKLDRKGKVKGSLELGRGEGF